MKNYSFKHLYYYLFKKKVKHSPHQIDGIKPHPEWHMKRLAFYAAKTIDRDIFNVFAAGTITEYTK